MARAPVVLALLTLVAVGACSRDPAFADRTAVVTWGSRTITFTVDSCGLDGQTAFVAGRSDSGATLQAVVGVEGDGETGVPASTGITVDDVDAVNLIAFGDEAWERRGETSDAPGEITTARVRGARIQASGEAVTSDDADRPLGGDPQTLTFDARCDAEGD